MTEVAPTPVGTFLAIAALGAVGFAIAMRRVGPTTWPLLAALFVYWLFIALGDRQPDSSRYVFVGAVLVIGVGADLLRARPPSAAALAFAAAVVAFSLTANLAKLGDGAAYMRADAELTRSEFAMLELAGERGDPDYLSLVDPDAAGGSLYIVMTTREYLESAAQRGSLAAPLSEVRESNIFIRQVDDVVLADALGLGLEPAQAPAGGEAGCRVTGGPGSVALPATGGLIGAESQPVALGLGRFVVDRPTKDLGELEPGRWARLALPGADRAPEPWRLFFDGPVRICSLDSA